MASYYADADLENKLIIFMLSDESFGAYFVCVSLRREHGPTFWRAVTNIVQAHVQFAGVFLRSTVSLVVRCSGNEFEGSEILKEMTSEDPVA